MSEEKEYINHLETISKQRSALMAIISGMFLSDTVSEEVAHLKGKIAKALVNIVVDDGFQVGDFIEVVTMEAMQSFVREQVELEKLKATAEGREWEED